MLLFLTMYLTTKLAEVTVTAYVTIKTELMQQAVHRIISTDLGETSSGRKFSSSHTKLPTYITSNLQFKILVLHDIIDNF